MKTTIKTLSVLLLAASAFQVSNLSNQASAGFGFDKPGWGVGLDPTVGPKLPRPPAPLGINVFEYDINTMRCAFARQNDGAWVEFQGQVRHRFAEVARNSEFIELFAECVYTEVTVLQTSTVVAGNTYTSVSHGSRREILTIH